MAATVNVNGQISDERQAVVSVLDHGFLYGEGVYETIRTYQQQPFLLDRHLTRLRTSAAMLDLPVPLSDEQFSARISETVAAAARSATGRDARSAEHDDTEWYIRILLTRGVGELTYDPAACPSPSVVIIVKPHADPAPQILKAGVRVALVSVVRNHPETVNPLIKSNNLLNSALAMQEAYRSGAFEAVMRNFRGELSECSQSNLFIVRNGEALTPPLKSGLLAGITRQLLFEIGPPAGVPVRENVLRDDDLYAADEAFLTSTTRELVPIVNVDGRPIGAGVPGPVTAQLREAFRRSARGSAVSR
jgi:branched-chain amino acid aminotransferase